MPAVVVSPVRTRYDRWAFMELPWSLYRDDPNWVPPLRDNLRELVGWKKHPFHDDAEVETFIARRGKRVCGRIAAILNHAHNRQYGERRGFFGWFESIDDQEVADALFAAVRDWHAQRDVTQIRGPFNPSPNYEIGLLVDGFDSPPTFMMTYNPPFYERLIRNAGYYKVQDLLAFIGELNQLPEIRERLAPMVQMAVERTGAQIRSMDTSDFMQEVRRFLELYNRSLVTMWGHVPLSDGELTHMAKAMRYLVVPQLAMGAEIDNEYVGVVLALPDFNPAIKASDGRLTPLGIWRLLRVKRRPRRIRILSINVVPEYQKWGLGLALMDALVPRGLESGIQEAEFSWIAESNQLPIQGMRKGGARLYKTYRVFDNEPPAEDTSSA